MQKNVVIAADLMEQAGRVARAEGASVDELAAEALRRELGRRILGRFKRQAEARRGGMTEQQVESTVEQAVREVRGRW